jgi:indolepyruvate ferredoxin oxidoreductase
VVLNRAEMPTGDLVLRRDADLMAGLREQEIANVVGAENLSGFNANEAAEALLGDAVLANVMMLGFAWQKGLVPVSGAALSQAIELNGVAIDKNRLAFAIGRAMAVDPGLVSQFYDETPEEGETLEQMIERRATFLTDYQDAAYAARYRATLDRLRGALPADVQDDLVTRAAKSLFKLMAYKDEFEVARLLTADSFKDQIEAEFDGDYSVKYHLAPPLLARGKDSRGRPKKSAFGPWLRPALSILAKAKGLRGSALNPFGYHEEARLHRDLLTWYENALHKIATSYSAQSHEDCAEVLSAPIEIRGYGPVRLDAAKTVRAEAEKRLARI